MDVTFAAAVYFDIDPRAPHFSETLLDNMEDLYQIQLILFKELFPNINLKPIQHYMVQFKTVGRANGRLMHEI